MELWMSAVGAAASSGRNSGWPVSKLRWSTARRGPSKGLIPVWRASIWYIGHAGPLTARPLVPGAPVGAPAWPPDVAAGVTTMVPGELLHPARAASAPPATSRPRRRRPAAPRVGDVGAVFTRNLLERWVRDIPTQTPQVPARTQCRSGFGIPRYSGWSKLDRPVSFGREGYSPRWRVEGGSGPLRRYARDVTTMPHQPVPPSGCGSVKASG